MYLVSRMGKRKVNIWMPSLVGWYCHRRNNDQYYSQYDAEYSEWGRESSRDYGK